MPSDQRPTIASTLDAFLADATHRRGLKSTTVTAYRYDLTLAASQLAMPLDELTLPAIEAFLSARVETVATTNRRIASLRRFLMWATRQGYCATNPAMLAESRRGTVALPRPIQQGTDLRAIDAALATQPQPYRLIFTILRETGMRANEVLGLNSADVCLDAGREGLMVREPKNRQSRTVVLTADLMPRSLRGLRAHLRALRVGEKMSTPLFRSNRGTRVSYDSLHYHWIQVCRAAGLMTTVDGWEQPCYTLHQLRHTAGTTFIAAYPEHIVSRMLGHRDPRSTRRYADVNDDQVRAALGHTFR